MSDVVIFQRHWQRRGLASLWASVNPILASGEWGVEEDNTGATPRKFKMGDGVTAWNLLPYSNPGAFVIDSIADADTTHAPSRNAVFDALAAEVAARDAAIGAAIAGLAWKQAVRVATTAAGTLVSSFENGDTVDGVILATGNRILIKNQAAGAENGIYTVNASGAPTRSTDADSGAELVNASCYVSEGATNSDSQWTCTTNAPVIVGSTSLAFAQLSTGGGISDGDKGDITVSGAGAVWAIDPNVVTYAKMQDVSATARVLGRKTAGSGDPEELSISEILDFIGSAARGDILYRGASAWIRLPAGIAGQVFSTNGSGADPNWATVAGGVIPPTTDPYFSDVKLLMPLTTAAGITDVTGKTATAYNGASIITTPGRYSASMADFDGVNDYIELAASADWNFGTADFEICGWMKSRQVSATYVGMIALNNASTGHWRVSNRVASTGNFGFTFYDGGYRDINSGVNANDGLLHYWRVRRIAGVFILELDGRIVTVNDSFTTLSVGASSYTLRLGYNAADNTYFKGNLQDVRITKNGREVYPLAIPSAALPTS